MGFNGCQQVLTGFNDFELILPGVIGILGFHCFSMGFNRLKWVLTSFY